MTDESVIEEAAKAIYETGVEQKFEDADEWNREIVREEATAALAVFEKAHAPTDARGKYTDAQMLYMICLALEEGIDGVKRIDLDDVLLKMISEHWGTADEDTSPEEAEAAFAQLAPYIPEHLSRTEPNGDANV